MQILATVRAFYLDIGEWAIDEPARWGPWAAPSPVRYGEISHKKDLDRRKSRMDQRTRERIPILPALIRGVETERHAAAERLTAAAQTPPGEQFTAAGQLLQRASSGKRATTRTWTEDPRTGTRRDLTLEEHRAFWAWAAIEVLRHTGIRIEELSELSHHDVIQYKLPGTGELIPLLHIAPSKTDVERLLVISPELADVLSTIICRVRGDDNTMPLVLAYDEHERTWLPPMPLLFQRRFGAEHRPIAPPAIRHLINIAVHRCGITGSDHRPITFAPHDFRRIFISDAIMHGMPPHIAQLVVGHRNIDVTIGYKAVYPEGRVWVPGWCLRIRGWCAAKRGGAPGEQPAGTLEGAQWTRECDRGCIATMVADQAGPGEWVLLIYRLPREPSTPRSAVWRRLRRLGVAQLSDGLVGLPADARTREQLEWVAGDVREAAGTAGVWIARPTSLAQERELASTMATARAQEYQGVRAEAEAAADLAAADRTRVVRRLREELRRIRRRDFFPPPERDTAVAAVEQLAAGSALAGRASGTSSAGSRR